MNEDTLIYFIIQKILAPTNKIEARLIELEDGIFKHKSKLTSFGSLSNKMDNQKQEISPEVYEVSSKRIKEYKDLKKKLIDEIEKAKYLMLRNPHPYL